MVSKLGLLKAVKQGLSEGLQEYTAQQKQKTSNAGYQDNLASLSTGNGSNVSANYTSAENPQGTLSIFKQAGSQFLKEAIPELTSDISKFKLATSNGVS